MRTLETLLADISVHDAYFSEEHLGPDGLVGVNTHGYAGDMPLHVVAWGSDTEGAEILLAAGANPNATGDMGETPLHVAVRQSNITLVGLLLKSGASTEVRSEFGETPREMAARIGGPVAAALARGGT